MYQGRITPQIGVLDDIVTLRFAVLLSLQVSLTSCIINSEKYLYPHKNFLAFIWRGAGLCPSIARSGPISAGRFIRSRTPRSKSRSLKRKTLPRFKLLRGLAGAGKVGMSGRSVRPHEYLLKKERQRTTERLGICIWGIPHLWRGRGLSAFRRCGVCSCRGVAEPATLHSMS